MRDVAEFVQVLTTVSSREEAMRIGRRLVERRLAACVQVLGPLRSIYWWKGSMEEAEEWLCIAKTRNELYSEVEKIIKELHPYEVPEITAVPIEMGSREYLEWLGSEVKSMRKGL